MSIVNLVNDSLDARSDHQHQPWCPAGAEETPVPSARSPTLLQTICVSVSPRSKGQGMTTGSCSTAVRFGSDSSNTGGSGDGGKYSQSPSFWHIGKYTVTIPTNH